MMSKEVQLPFVMEIQMGERMCWAAVAISVANFFSESNVSSQLEFAKMMLGKKYNQFYSPESALQYYNNLRSSYNRPFSLDEIKKELCLGNPIVACLKHFVGWHLVVIYGVYENQLYIEDPLIGMRKCEIATFTTTYEMYYSWTHTYTTKPSSY